MCAADAIHSVPAKRGITTKLSKRDPTTLKRLGDLTATKEPQLRAGCHSGTNVDLVDI